MTLSKVENLRIGLEADKDCLASLDPLKVHAGMHALTARIAKAEHALRVFDSTGALPRWVQ
jgi:hypothetical protein